MSRWGHTPVMVLASGILFYLFIYLFFIELYWSIIASQYCVSFCCTPKQISHMHTHVPSLWDFRIYLGRRLTHMK